MNDQVKTEQPNEALNAQSRLNAELEPTPVQREMLDVFNKIAEASMPQKRDVVSDDVVWLNIYCAVANLFNSEKHQALAWADNGLEEYRKRFKT